MRSFTLAVCVIVFTVACTNCFVPDNTVTWVPCPLNSNIAFDPSELKTTAARHAHQFEQFRTHRQESVGFSTSVVQEGNFTHPVVECAFVKVPLLWDKPNDSRGIEVFIKRVKGPANKKKGQLWILQGGPGGSGAGLEGFAQLWNTHLNGQYDLIFPDHRGTGRSELFGMDCFQQGVFYDWPKCFGMMKNKYGADSLYGFGTTMAAHDLHHISSLLKVSGEAVAVFGVSYGTLWLNRLLTIYPGSVDIAVADSVVRTDIEFTDRDDHYSETGADLIALCAGDPVCAGKFQGDATLSKKIESILRKQDSSNACKPGNEKLPSERARRILANMLISIDTKKLIFPFLFRLKRCNKGDKIWLDNLGFQVAQQWGIVPAASAAMGDPNSLALYLNDFLMNLIAGSEMSNETLPHSREYWVNRYKDVSRIFHFNLSAELVDIIKVMNNSKYVEPLRKTYATNYQGPLLIMHGTLDPQTPASSALQWQKEFPKATFQWVKNAGHSTSARTPDATTGSPVGIQAIAQWILNNGVQPVNTAILERWRDYQYNFNSSPTSFLISMTGHDNLFEGTPSTQFHKDSGKDTPDKSKKRRRIITPIVVIIGSLLILAILAVVIVGVVLFVRSRAIQGDYKEKFLGSELADNNRA